MKQYSRNNFLEIIVGSANIGAEEKKPPVSGNSARVKTSKLGLAPYAGGWGKTQLMHLLRRSLFGVSHSDYSFFAGLGLNQSIDKLLTRSGPVPPPVNNYNSKEHIDPKVPPGKTWIDTEAANMDINGRRIYSLKSWWVGLMLNQDRSLTEKMTLFWHNHFATQMLLVLESRYSYRHLVLLRSNALGNFKHLVKEITTDPAMLVFLNGNTNTAGVPNENYARELQELFTAGKGPDSHYTEGDVKAAARVLTGWRDVNTSVSSVFNPADHDSTDKKFSPFYGDTIIKGRTSEGGTDELNDFIEMIFRQREVAKYFCRKLYRWFVYYMIDADIEKQVIEPMAEILIANNFEVAPVLKALLSSEHFYDPVNFGCQIKNPADTLIGQCRQFDVAFPGPENINKQYLGWYLIYEKMANTAMDVGDPPGVSGWAAYYQVPQFYELWINSSTYPARNENSDLLCSNKGIVSDGLTLAFDNTGQMLQLQTDVLAFTAKFENSYDPDLLIAESTEFLCPNRFDDKQRAILKSILLSGQSSKYYWTEAWAAYQKDKDNAENKSVVSNRLIQFYSYIMARAEYQLI